MTRLGPKPGGVALAVLVGWLGSAACGSESAEPPPSLGSGGTAGTGGSARGGSGGTGARGGTSGAGATGGTDAGGDGSGALGGSGGDSGAASGGMPAEPGDAGAGGAFEVPLGPELCGDGVDNDRDGGADCDDSDCEQACASCDSVELLADPSTLTTTNFERPGAPPSDCVATGPALIYEVVAASTGFLEVEAEGPAFLRTAIFDGCDDQRALSCGTGRASVPVSAGARRFVRISGLEPQDVGEVTLTVRSRPANVCGDGYQDPSESCDDTNVEAGDGCGADCRVESTETEPNDTLGTASAWLDPFYGTIEAAEDVDYVVFDVAELSTLTVDTEPVNAGACEGRLLDNAFELFDASGSPLAEDEDGGDGYCARLVRPFTQPGQYVVRVTASPPGDTAPFPYRLVVSTEPSAQ